MSYPAEDKVRLYPERPFLRNPGGFFSLRKRGRLPLRIGNVRKAWEAARKERVRCTEKGGSILSVLMPVPAALLAAGKGATRMQPPVWGEKGYGLIRHPVDIPSGPHLFPYRMLFPAVLPVCPD